MANYTSNTYQMKREILFFSNKISRNLPKPERKFIADMNYGILASGSCLLTDIVDQLHEPSRKINIVDRLSRHLAKGIPKNALKAYLTQVKIQFENFRVRKLKAINALNFYLTLCMAFLGHISMKSETNHKTATLYLYKNRADWRFGRLHSF